MKLFETHVLRCAVKKISLLPKNPARAEREILYQLRKLSSYFACYYFNNTKIRIGPQDL